MKITHTIAEWRAVIERSEGCPICKCKLIEIDEECQQVMCPRCCTEREDLTAKVFGGGRD